MFILVEDFDVFVLFIMLEVFVEFDFVLLGDCLELVVIACYFNIVWLYFLVVFEVRFFCLMGVLYVLTKIFEGDMVVEIWCIILIVLCVGVWKIFLIVIDYEIVDG